MTDIIEAETVKAPITVDLYVVLVRRPDDLTWYCHTSWPTLAEAGAVMPGLGAMKIGEES